MARKQDKNILVGLDIGTSKVTAIVGEMSPDGEIEIIGVGSRISTGLKRGVVVNIELTVQSIQRAIEEAELMAGCDITSVVAGVAGSNIQSLNSHGVAAVKENEITRNEVEKVIESARAMAIPAEHKILHVLPQEYVIDGQAGVKVPEGMSGIRQEAKVHIITGALSAVENIIRCVTRCGLEVENVVLEQLASSHSVLTEDEKELATLHFNLGTVYLKMGNADDAEYHFGETVYYSPDDTEAIFGLALVLEEEGRFRSALNYYKDLIDKDPTNPDYFRGAYRATFNDGDPITANEYLQKAKALEN